MINCHDITDHLNHLAHQPWLPHLTTTTFTPTHLVYPTTMMATTLMPAHLIHQQQRWRVMMPTLPSCAQHTDDETCWRPLAGRRAGGTTVSLHPHSYGVCHQTILAVQRIPIADLHPRSCSTQCVNSNPATCTSIVVPMVSRLAHWQ